MKQKYDIVIAGAGMVGLTIANLLAQSEHNEIFNITIVDAGDRPSFSANAGVSLRVSAVAAGSSTILERIGVWSRIVKNRSCPFRKMKVWDASGDATGPETLVFDAAEFAVPQLGYIIENLLIQDALASRLDAHDVAVHFGTKISAIAESGGRYSVRLESGKSLHADLLLAADGAGSFVRTQAGISVRSWQYQQKAFVTHLATAESHRNTAWQRFTDTGPIGLLPLQDGRVSTVWSTTPDQADEAMSASDEDLAAMLTTASDHALGKLTPDGPRGAFPLRAQHASQYVLPGLALLGDAAHAVHPLAGQGANLGFSDAAELAAVIEAAVSADENPGDLPVLRRFERARKKDNLTMLYFVDGLNRLFSNDSAQLARLRGAGMRIFNRSGPIRERAVQVALGLR